MLCPTCNQALRIHKGKLIGFDKWVATEFPGFKEGTMDHKYYRTVFKIEVLSREPMDGHLTLADIHYEITDGHCSGMFLESEEEECDAKRISVLLEAQNSDPTFLFEEEAYKDEPDSDSD